MKPVSLTAYYCCGVRAIDAASPHPICDDRFAERFMSDPGAARVMDMFAAHPEANASNVTRHRIIDDLLRVRLGEDPGTRVYLIGAGFDSRAFRLTGGDWVEIDEPAVLSLKEERLPAASCPNRLRRVPIDFGRESLRDHLEQLKVAGPAVFIVEGVLMYLTGEQIRGLAQAIRATQPGSTLICDLMTARFARRVSHRIRKDLARLGAHFPSEGQSPLDFLLPEGLALRDRISIIGRARELGALKIPRILLNTLLRTLRDGYTIGVLSTEPSVTPSLSSGPLSRAR